VRLFLNISVYGHNLLILVHELWSRCAVKALSAIKEAFQDPENVLISWDPNYLSPCTFAFVECDANQSVFGL
jgi:hypothetical protein